MNADLERVVLDRLESTPTSVGGAGSLRHWLLAGEVLLDILLETVHPEKAKGVLSQFRTRAAAGERAAECAIEIVDQRTVSDLTGRKSLIADQIANESVADYAGAVKDLLTALASAHGASELTTIRESLTAAGTAGNPLAPDLVTLLAAAAGRRPTSSQEKVPDAFAAPMQFIPPTSAGEAEPPKAIPKNNQRQSRARPRAPWIIGAATLVAVLGTVGIAFGTATRWTVVDTQEHPETYYEEDYKTSLYEVKSADAYLCSIGQDWQECIGLLNAEYNDDCARYGTLLTAESRRYCAWYRQLIDSMEREKAPPGSTVGGAGTVYKVLTSGPEIATREVSNNDYEPATKHKAVCYLGFIGECP